MCYHDSMNKEFSGKILLRIGPALHRVLAIRASKGQSSINALCARLLKDGLQRQSEGNWWSEDCKKIVWTLRRRFGRQLLGVAVFGSQIEGTATEDSDLDILIVLDVPIRRSLYLWWDENIKWQGRSGASPQFVHLPDDVETAGGIWFEVAMASQILWERGRRLSSTIAKIKVLIETDRVRRYWSNGQPYWVRRENEEQRSGT